MGIGSTWRRAHETKEAGKAFRTALGIAREHKDMAAVAANLNNVALLEWDSGDLKAAEAGLKESVSVAKAAGDDMGEGIGQTNLADLYLIQLRERESENLRLESAETFRRAGDLLQFKRIKARWAIDISRVGRGREALDALERLIGVSGRSIRTNRRARSIDEGDLSLLLALIEVYRDSGDRGRTANAIGSLLHIARDTERRDLEAQAWMESALTDEAFGDMVVALHDLKQAENLLREMGNSEGLGAVYVRSGTIRLQSGLRDEALVDLREAVRHAELSGSVASHAAALGELGEALGSVSAEGRECLEMSRQLRKAGRVKAHDRS